MSTSYFVEILNNNGDVHTRQQYPSLPIRIGRAYSNDVILDDLHTAAEHAVIDLDQEGTLTIRNLENHNGIRRKGVRNHSFAITGDSVFHLGRTQLRVRTNNYVVAPEIIDDVNHRWQGWPMALFALFIIGLIGFSNAWLSDIENNKTAPYIMNICMWFGYSLLWAGVWSLANRVFGGATHFSRHLMILACGLAALYVWGYVAIILAYGFSWTLLTRFGNHPELVLAVIIIYNHLYQITPRKHKRLKIICVAFTVFCSSLILMKNYQTSDQYADELYMHDILPPMVRMSRNHSLDEFNNNISALKTTIDKEKEKARKENNK